MALDMEAFHDAGVATRDEADLTGLAEAVATQELMLADLKLEFISHVILDLMAEVIRRDPVKATALLVLNRQLVKQGLLGMVK
jgi:hypothetical protein